MKLCTSRLDEAPVTVFPEARDPDICFLLIKEFFQNVFQHQTHQFFLPVVPKLLPAHDLDQGRIDLTLFCIHPVELRQMTIKLLRLCPVFCHNICRQDVKHMILLFHKKPLAVYHILHFLLFTDTLPDPEKCFLHILITDWLQNVIKASHPNGLSGVLEIRMGSQENALNIRNFFFRPETQGNPVLLRHFDIA